MAPFKGKAKGTRHPGVKRLGENRWLVHATWTDPRTGRRRHRRQIVEGTLEDATSKRAALRGRERGDNAPSRPRFSDFAADWLRARKSKLGPSTLARYTNDVANLSVEFGAWWVDAVTYDELERWQSKMADEYAAPTVNGWHRTMRLILDAAVRRRLLASNPARELSALPEGRTKGARGTSLSATQLRAFAAAIAAAVEAEKITAQQGRVLTALAWTGMRLGEIVALRWSDAVEGELRVERSVWRGHEQEDKTDDPRRITIVEPLQLALDEQRRWLLTTQHPGLESGLVFPGAPKQARAGAARRGLDAPGWHMSQSTIQDAMLEVCTVAGCPRITPHSLRRTFEDVLREAGVEQMVRRAMAGWRSERAEGIYATVRREERDAAAGAMIRLVLG